MPLADPEKWRVVVSVSEQCSTSSFRTEVNLESRWREFDKGSGTAVLGLFVFTSLTVGLFRVLLSALCEPIDHLKVCMHEIYNSNNQLTMTLPVDVHHSPLVQLVA